MFAKMIVVPRFTVGGWLFCQMISENSLHGEVCLMRNLYEESLDVRTNHLGCEYCGNADKHWRYYIQYLRDIKEIVSQASEKTASLAMCRSFLI